VEYGAASGSLFLAFLSMERKKKGNGELGCCLLKFSIFCYVLLVVFLRFSIVILDLHH
jgi:hypothetical protein